MKRLAVLAIVVACTPSVVTEQLVTTEEAGTTPLSAPPGPASPAQAVGDYNVHLTRDGEGCDRLKPEIDLTFTFVDIGPDRLGMTVDHLSGLCRGDYGVGRFHLRGCVVPTSSTEILMTANLDIVSDGTLSGGVRLENSMFCSQLYRAKGRK